MLERQQIAAILFFLGLGLLLIGFLGVGVAERTNFIAVIAGAVFCVAGVAWWQLLKRRGL